MRLAILFPLVLVGCSFEGEIEGSYDPATRKINIRGNADGRSIEKSVELEDLEIVNGEYIYEDDDCGTIKINAEQFRARRFKIMCSDPLLVQVPDSWTVGYGTWTTSSDSGDLIADDVDDYEPSYSAPITLESGYQAFVIYADTTFPSGATLDFEASFGSGGTDATGAVVKGVEVHILQFLDTDGSELGDPILIPAEGEPDPDFSAINDSAHTLTIGAAGGDTGDTGGSSSGGSGGGGGTSCGGCGRLGASPASFMAAFGLGLAGLGLRRRKK